MKYFTIKYLLILSLFYPFKAYCQNFTVSGYVEQKSTGERLINANVFNKNTMQGCVTNNYGYYSLSLKKGTVNLSVRYVGYQEQNITFNLTKDTIINFQLVNDNKLKEIVIVGNKSSNIDNSQISMINLPIVEIKKLPMLMGETDVIKAIQFLPGIQSGIEGTSGLHVRGGAAGQNLILIDGIPVYNISHFYGFFSVFNGNAVKNVNVYKGGFPARYGGRVSSVVDVRIKEGSTKKFSGEGSVGILSSKLTLEIPIIKNKASFLVSGRRTYLDLLFIPILNNLMNENYPKYYFYDLNAKINYKFSGKSRLYLSFYAGKDHIDDNNFNEKLITETSEFEKVKSTVSGWGNIISSLRWNYILNSKLFTNITLAYSNYNYFAGTDYHTTMKDFTTNKVNNSIYRSNYNSNINDIIINIDFDWSLNDRHNLKFGAGDILHTFIPGNTHYYKSIDELELLIDTVYENEDIKAHEFSVYIEDDIHFSDKLKTNIGIRYMAFFLPEKTYNSIQPRVSAGFKLSNNFALKAGFSTMEQFIHLLSNSNLSMPNDIWVPATEFIKPLNSNQYNLGFIYNLKHKFEFTSEIFYKTTDNILAYKEGVNYLSDNVPWQDKTEAGSALAYGLELMIEKQSGKTNGKISYTLLKAEQQFANINQGNKFPDKYDRRHDLSINISHSFNKNIELNINWVLSSGYPSTISTSQFQDISGIYNIDNELIGLEYFPSRNNYYLPVYHRLDLNVNFYKTRKYFKRTLSIGIYNVYNRKNPIYAYMGYSAYMQRIVKYKSLLPIMPSISYSFKF